MGLYRQSNNLELLRDSQLQILKLVALHHCMQLIIETTGDSSCRKGEMNRWRNIELQQDDRHFLRTRSSSLSGTRLDFMMDTSLRLLGLPYDRKFKSPNHQDGTVYLTSHRICYVDETNPMLYSIGAYLEQTETSALQLIAGWLLKSFYTRRTTALISRPPLPSKMRLDMHVLYFLKSIPLQLLTHITRPIPSKLWNATSSRRTQTRIYAANTPDSCSRNSQSV